jgi:hypothetical protein
MFMILGCEADRGAGIPALRHSLRLSAPEAESLRFGTHLPQPMNRITERTQNPYGAPVTIQS